MIFNILFAIASLLFYIQSIICTVRKEWLLGFLFGAAGLLNMWAAILL